MAREKVNQEEGRGKRARSGKHKVQIKKEDEGYGKEMKEEEVEKSEEVCRFLYPTDDLCN